MVKIERFPHKEEFTDKFYQGVRWVLGDNSKDDLRKAYPNKPFSPEWLGTIVARSILNGWEKIYLPPRLVESVGGYKEARKALSYINIVIDHIISDLLGGSKRDLGSRMKRFWDDFVFAMTIGKLKMLEERVGRKNDYNLLENQPLQVPQIVSKMGTVVALIGGMGALGGIYQMMNRNVPEEIVIASNKVVNHNDKRDSLEGDRWVYGGLSLELTKLSMAMLPLIGGSLNGREGRISNRKKLLLLALLGTVAVGCGVGELFPGPPDVTFKIRYWNGKMVDFYVDPDIWRVAYEVYTGAYGDKPYPQCDPRLMLAIAFAESPQYSKNAVSSAGAAGPWQIMPETWEIYALRKNFPRTNLSESALTACRYVEATGITDADSREQFIDRFAKIPPIWNASPEQADFVWRLYQKLLLEIRLP